jgi:hypothetical protein
MIEPGDLARVYLLVTAIEAHVEDGEGSIAEALRWLYAEHADTTGDVLPAVPDAELVRRELRFARRLLDALYANRPDAYTTLHRPERLCATPGCGNDAVVWYCLSCEARRAVQR